MGSELRFEVGQGEKAIAPTLLVDAHEEVHWFSSGFKFIKAFVRKLLWPCSTTPNLCVFEGMRERSSHPALHGGLQAAAEVGLEMLDDPGSVHDCFAREGAFGPSIDHHHPRHLEDDSNVIFSRVEALSVRRGEDLLNALRPTEQFWLSSLLGFNAVGL